MDTVRHFLVSTFRLIIIYPGSWQSVPPSQRVDPGEGLLKIVTDSCSFKIFVSNTSGAIDNVIELEMLTIGDARKTNIFVENYYQFMFVSLWI